MKRTITTLLIVGAAIVFVPAIEAKPVVPTTNASATQQWEQDRRRGQYDRRDRRNDRRWNDRRGNNRRINDRRWNNGRGRSYITTRIVRRWFRTYRETIRVTYLPNGRVRTQVLRRVRIR
ncbi:MAG: hypothetical protein IPM25_12980 [Chloracidobacterium sp.]|nr:hypothetical protein [Chloracidobacterium sp.]